MRKVQNGQRERAGRNRGETVDNLVFGVRIRIFIRNHLNFYFFEKRILTNLDQKNVKEKEEEVSSSTDTECCSSNTRLQLSRLLLNLGLSNVNAYMLGSFCSLLRIRGASAASFS